MEKPEELHIKIDDFEGPLDLLLHLIKEMKVDIQDVSMIAITDQYLAFIHSMQEMQLDIAGDYLVMAATLLEIKSRLLLPRVEETDMDDFEYEGEDILQEELMQQLIEYKQFKDAAILLKEKEVERGHYFTKEPTDLDYLQSAVPLASGELSIDDLIHAFQKMLQKQKDKQPLQATIAMDHVSVEETMQHILTRVRTTNDQTGVPLSDFIDSKETLIATFLAVLELTKFQQVVFKQEQLYDMIFVYPGQKIHEDRLVNITSGE